MKKILALTLCFSLTSVPVLLPAILPALALAHADSTTAKPLRLVIVPFKNITRQAEDDWLSDSFSESLTMGLVKVKSLQLIERSQMDKLLKEQHFGQSLYVQPESAPELGQMLGAELVLMGSYQKIGSQIQVNVRFVDVETGQIDSERTAQVQGDFQDIFKLQKQLARQLLQELSITAESTLLNSLDQSLTATTSTEAYQNYMQGLTLLRYEDFKLYEQAVRFFKKALVDDPNYVLAHAGLAEAYLLQAEHVKKLKVYPETQNILSPENLRQSAEQAVNKALSLEPDSTQALRVFARLKWFSGARSEALALMKRSIQLNPNDGDSVRVYFDFKLQTANQSLDLESFNQELKKLGANTRDPWFQLRLAEYLFSFGSVREDGRSKVEQAENILTSLAKELPDLAQIPFLQSKIAHYQKQDQLAIQFLKQAYTLAGNQFDFKVNLIRFAHAYGAVELGNQWLKESEQKNPNHIQILFIKADVLFDQGRLQEAQVLYDRMDQLSNDHPLVPFQLGTFYLYSKDEPAKALPLLQEALKRVEKHPDFGRNRVLDALMNVSLYAGDLEHGAEIAKTLLDDPDYYAPAYRMVALNHSIKGEYADALKAYQALLTIHPELKEDQNLVSWYRRAYLEVELEKDPENVPALLDLGQIVLEQTQPLPEPKSRDVGFGLAEEYFKYAQEIDPQNPLVFNRLGYLYLVWEKLDAAQTALEQATRLKPDFVKAWYNLGLVYVQVGQKEQARKAWSKVLEFDMNHQGARQGLAAL